MNYQDKAAVWTAAIMLSLCVPLIIACVFLGG